MKEATRNVNIDMVLATLIPFLEKQIAETKRIIQWLENLEKQEQLRNLQEFEENQYT